MKVKFTLSRAGGESIDLVATTDAAATVGDLADYLSRADPERGARTKLAEPPTLTLALIGDGGRSILDPALAVGETGLRSGAVVEVVAADASRSKPTRNVGVLTVVEGPNAGTEFPLVEGGNRIGRGQGCEVRLEDPLVSRLHARLNISDLAEVVDLGSANGVQVGGATVARTLLRRGDLVRVGDTIFQVSLEHSASAIEKQPAVVNFIRPPRLDPLYGGVKRDAPEPPERPAAQRVPIAALLAPLLMGALLYAVTRSTASLIFVALSPLMLVGNAVESRIASRLSYKKALKEWRQDVASLVEEAASASYEEVAARCREHPSVEDCGEAILRRSPLLWARRPGEPGFGEIRLGLGWRPARNSIEMPTSRHVPRALLQELGAALARFATVSPVPVIARPAEQGAIGIAGPRAAMLAAARAAVMQVAALHSPAELVIVGLASPQAATAWDWVKWLPHVTSAHSPVRTDHLVCSPAGATKLVAELEELIERRTNGGAAVPAVLVLVEHDAPLEHSRLVELAERGAAHGVIVLWLAPDVVGLPAACRTFLAVARAAEGAVGYVHSGEQVEPVAVDSLSEERAVELARQLSPLVDIGARSDDASDLPRAVSFLALAGTSLGRDPVAVIERWTESQSLLSGPFGPPERPKSAGALRAVIGQGSAGEAHALDLRTDGPHALVGGTTGSGKSELLQTWILSLAASHSPQRLNFLLIDYKGEAAFRDCKDLPHTVGLVTDLNPHLVRRALTSLAAELHRRERILARHNAKDLETLERQGHADAPPSLVIVVDEFAALVQEMPDFVDGVVNVAQRGRSLGLHLILATQQPSGVIKGNLRANTNLRLALRVADEIDSTDVLGSPDAAFFDPSMPGRAVSKTGPNRLLPFQAGYVGGWTSETPPPPEIDVEPLLFGAGEAWLPDESDAADPEDKGATDIERLVATIRAASETAAIPPPRKPWLPELGHAYDLIQLTDPAITTDPGSLVFGVVDDPHKQAQPLVAFTPDRDGNLAVYGTGGSGKSTFLRTIAAAASFAPPDALCQVYGLDFGARGLAALEPMPHVGGIINGADEERVTRLITLLRAAVDERAARYAAASAGSITEYRRRSGAPGDPRIVVLIDGIGAFRQAYESGDRGRLFDTFVSICADGRPVGVHVVLSADRPGAVPTALAATVQRRLVLRLADDGDYAMLGVPGDVVTSSSPPGRGLYDGFEVQVAILGPGVDSASQAVAIRARADWMRVAGVHPAAQIERLTERVDLDELPVRVADNLPAIGIESTSLSVCGFDPRGTFVVTGPSGSGRTTTLTAVLASLRRSDPRTTFHYIGSDLSPIVDLSIWHSRLTSAEDVVAAGVELGEALRAPTALPGVLVVEGVSDFANGPADTALQEIIKTATTHGHFVVVEGEVGSLIGGYGIMSLIRTNRSGVCLQPDQGDGSVFRADFPRYRRADFPLGRGVLVQRGVPRIVQFALPSDLV